MAKLKQFLYKFLKRILNPRILKVHRREDFWDAQTIPEVPSAWIQWKGTDVCMDVRCTCGGFFHVDADFAYYVKCPGCLRIFATNGHIELTEVMIFDGPVETGFSFIDMQGNELNNVR